jgi:hydrogenase maturation factor
MKVTPKSAPAGTGISIHGNTAFFSSRFTAQHTESPVRISTARAEVGDKVIMSGIVGDHDTTVMIARGGLELEADIKINDTY